MKWEEEEVEKLKKLEGLSVGEILQYFPNRTDSSVRAKLNSLNLQYSKVEHRFIKEGKPMCSKCKEYKTLDNFNNKKHCLCNECVRKVGYINRFYRKYNIKLDFQLMHRTFTVEEWVELLLGGKIKELPKGIFTKDDAVNATKYVIECKLGRKEKEEIVKTTANEMKSHKIHTMIYQLISDNWLEILNTVYPDFAIEGFELSESPKGYWKDIRNADKYLKYYCDYIKSKYHLLNFEKDIPYFLKYEKIREFKFNPLINCIHTFSHYSSFYEWLSAAYPNLNFNKEDFSMFIGVDQKSILDSSEEKTVFDFIYLNITNKINAIGTKRDEGYYNKKENENYFPDFEIILQGKKKLIIEYYGLVRDNSKDSIYIDYRNKIDRKNRYFQSLSDSFFIDLYPKDLKNNCEGVDKKLAPFFCGKNDM